MPDLILPQNLANAEVADATKVMDDLNAIKSHSNNDLVHRDGSRVMTAHLSLVNSTPANPTDAASKGYVDTTVTNAVNFTPKSAWTAWTPLVTQTNTPTQTATGVYKRVDGDLYIVRGKISFTGAGTAGAAILVANLPGNPVDLVEDAVGTFDYFDNGTGWYDGTALMITGDKLQFRLGGTNNGANFALGTAVTIANLDILTFTVTYQGA